MFDDVLGAATRLADTVRECEMPADDDVLLAGVRAAVAARNAADGLLTRLTGEIECRDPARPRARLSRADRARAGDRARGGGCPQISLVPQIARSQPERGC